MWREKRRHEGLTRQTGRPSGFGGRLLNIQGGVSLKWQRSGRSPDASVCWIRLSVQEVLRRGGGDGQDGTRQERGSRRRQQEDERRRED